MINLTEILNKVFSAEGNAFFYTPPYYRDSYSYIFENTLKTISLSEPNNVEFTLREVDKHINEGLLFHSSLKYELGYCFEERLDRFLNDAESPLGSFNFFPKENVIKIKSDTIAIEPFINTVDKLVTNFRMSTSKKDFTNNINAIKKYIADGYTYQVNYTVSCDFDVSCELNEFISTLIFNQSARYIAIINNDPEIIVSVSPELFFSIKGSNIISRPMKGTIKRGHNLSEDSNLLNQLLNSYKDRAENIMIVDLIRNDLGRICRFDSVKNTHQFVAEKYESVYQLTSVVEGELSVSSTYEVLKNIFPCGSITGAPKIKTMEIIKELEKRERGVYTGAIGFYNGDQSVFNVPIRTIEINTSTKKSKIGIGSGIVWDSNAESEYEECKSKASFVTNPQPYFELIETILLEKGKIFLLDYHLERLRKASDFFLFIYDEEKIKNEIGRIIKKCNISKNYKIKLLLDKWGNAKVSASEYKLFNSTKVLLSNELVSTFDRFQYFKTTNRSLYDESIKLARSKGYFDCLFLNERDELAEGAITNVFIKRKDKLITPPIDSGILDGCYRKFLLDNNEAEEDLIRLEELRKTKNLFVGNSVLKLISVQLV